MEHGKESLFLYKLLLLGFRSVLACTSQSQSSLTKALCQALGLETHFAKELFSTNKSRTVCVNFLRKPIYFPSFSREQSNVFLIETILFLFYSL